MLNPWKDKVDEDGWELAGCTTALPLAFGAVARDEVERVCRVSGLPFALSLPPLVSMPHDDHSFDDHLSPRGGPAFARAFDLDELEPDLPFPWSGCLSKGALVPPRLRCFPIAGP